MIMLVGIVPMANAASSAESESNDTYSSADVLSVNGTISGKMGTDNDIDFYKITTSSTGKLTVKFNHTYVDNSSVYWNIYLYYYTEGQLKELSYKKVYGTSSETINFSTIGTVSSGTYYVKITTYYDATTKYNYSVNNTFVATSYYEKEFNDSFATATAMNLNSSYGGYMNNDNDSDFYKITTSYNGKLVVNFKHTFVDSSSVYWNVYIYRYVNGNYIELSYKRIYGGDNESISFPTIGAVASGSYYIKVTTYYDATENYEYSISNSFSSTDYYEREPNDSFAEANTIILNQAYGGFMNNDDDGDFYKLSLSSSSVVTFNFNHSYVNSSSVYWNVYVYNYSGGAYNEIAYKRIYGSDSEIYTLMNKTSLSAGTYYVKITTYYDVTTQNEYSIKFSSGTSTSYTVNYNANGGSVSPSSASVTQGSSVTLPTPTKSYTLYYNANGGSNAPSSKSVSLSCKGWSTSSSATSASYSCGSSYKPTSNTTLYAVWNSSVGTYLSSSKPSRSGYTFLGWATQSNATSPSFSAGASVTLSGNATLYAVWQKNSTPEPEQPSVPTVEYKTIFLNYKDTYKIEANGFRVSEYYAEDGTIVSVDSEGTVRANATGSARVFVYDENYDIREVYTFDVQYTWWQWIILIVLFGWIWY